MDKLFDLFEDFEAASVADDMDDSIYDEDDDFDPFYDEETEREEERWAFENVPKHGIHAHAYKKELDNLRMKKLREKGYSYRKIGKHLGCSPSTVRNRLKKLGK